MSERYVRHIVILGKSSKDDVIKYTPYSSRRPGHMDVIEYGANLDGDFLYFIAAINFSQR
jgi:hypothetical protein